MAESTAPTPHRPRRFLSPGWLIAYCLIAMIGIFLVIRLPRCAETRTNLARLRAEGVRMVPHDWIRKFGAGEDFFAVFYDIPYLAIHEGDRVPPEHLEILARLPNVDKVDLNGCDLPADLSPIGRIRRLENLDLSGSKVTAAALASIDPRNRIRRLNLRESGLRDADLGVLASWCDLRQLTLHPSQITPATVEAVSLLKSLEELRMEKREGGHWYLDIAWHDGYGKLDMARVMRRVSQFSTRR